MCSIPCKLGIVFAVSVFPITHACCIGIALSQLIKLGVPRVLTSGGAAKAIYGIELLASLLPLGANNIKIMAGGGVDASNVMKLGM